MIRKATVEDLKEIDHIYDEVLTDEENNGPFTNWKRGLYPTIKVAEDALAKETLYVGADGDTLYGCIILNHVQPEEYRKIPWSIEAQDHQVLVIHTLCIRPSQSGKGRGKAFVAFAEDHGRALGCEVMRLDTYEGNKPAANLYTKLGYRLAGSTLFNFQQVIVETLICFEKALHVNSTK